jgi:hypothetical protein
VRQEAEALVVMRRAAPDRGGHACVRVSGSLASFVTDAAIVERRELSGKKGRRSWMTSGRSG